MAHRLVFDAIADHLHAGQTVIISAHLSLGALYLQRLLAQRGIALPVVGWSTTLLRARKTDGHTIRIATIRKKVDIGVVPAGLSKKGLAVCQDLFGDHFNLRSGILAVSLSNVNPQSHMALALLNFTRMERGEEWDQAECSTSAVKKLNGALDGERMRIASELGLEVRSLQEHRDQTHGKESGAKVATFGPATTETRYTLEDVPFGLVPTLRIARIAGVEVPFHQAGIAFFSALYGRDFESENDLIRGIALEAMSLETFVQVCKDGFPVSQTAESRHSLHGG
jgi:opine dehydrogenase